MAKKKKIPRRDEKNTVKTVVFILVIIVAGISVYANSLSGEFIWDDEVLVKGNPRIRNWSNLPRIFSEDIGAGAARKYGFYRPLQMVTYTADYSLWKKDVRGYHLTNILLHVLAGLSFFWLAQLLFRDRILSFFSALLFTVHPAHTEAVAYVSGRADPLSLLFMLLCAGFYVKVHIRRRFFFFVLVPLFYAAALLSRENSLIVPVLLLLWHYTFKKRINPGIFTVLLVMSLIYIVLRVTIFSSFLPHGTSSTTVFQRFPGFFAALVNYLRILLVPVHLHMEYGRELFNFADLRVIAGIVVFALLLIPVFRMKKDVYVFFSVLWFLITLFPVANIYPVNAYMAEHWLYLPSIGLFLLAGRIFSRLLAARRTRSAAVFCAVLLPLIYGYLTVRQNVYWREPVNFYTRTLKYARGSPRMHNNFGLVLNSAGRREEAITMYRKALELNPAYAETHNNLGNAYRDFGRLTEAMESFKKAIEIRANYPEAHYNLGTVYNLLGSKEEAASLFRKAITLNPEYAKAYNDLAIVHSLSDEKEKAIELFRKAIAVDPDYAEAYNNLGSALNESGRKEEAVAMYRKALSIRAAFVEPYYNLGMAYGALGKWKESIEFFEKAIEINSDYGPAHRGIAVALFHSGRYEAAVEHCDRAVELGCGVSPEFLKLLKPHRR